MLKYLLFILLLVPITANASGIRVYWSFANNSPRQFQIKIQEDTGTVKTYMTPALTPSSDALFSYTIPNVTIAAQTAKVSVGVPNGPSSDTLPIFKSDFISCLNPNSCLRYDANNDSKLTITDVQRIQKHVAGSIKICQ